MTDDRFQKLYGEYYEQYKARQDRVRSFTEWLAERVLGLRALNAELVKSLEGLLSSIGVNEGEVGITSDRQTVKLIRRAEAVLDKADRAES